MKNKLWFVWCPRGSIPQFKHETVESAKAEAERLARLNPGTEFLVLASLGSVVKNDLLWTEHITEFNENDLPF